MKCKRLVVYCIVVFLHLVIVTSIVARVFYIDRGVASVVRASCWLLEPKIDLMACIYF